VEGAVEGAVEEPAEERDMELSFSKFKKLVP
jgi:hypothetical protein